MNKHYKLFILFSVFMIGIFSWKLYTEIDTSKKIKELSIKYEAESLSNFLVAFRTIYQSVFIKNHTQLNESNIDFLPVKTLSNIADVYSTLNSQSKISTVSDKPRNSVNMANARQLEAINKFKNDKNLKSLFKNIDGKYYYSQPLYITKTCLKCHGNKTDAPSIIQDNYDKAYGYKLGDVRGILDIEVTQTKLGELLDKKSKMREYYVLIFLSLIIGGTFLYAKYNKNLEEQIEEELQKNTLQDQQLLQQSRFAQMGEMISMIAHQWRQPLNSINLTSNNLQLKCMLDDINKEEFEKELSLIGDYSQHLSKTIDDFRDFFKDKKDKEISSFKEIVTGALDIVSVSIKNKNISIYTDFGCNDFFETFPSEVKQVVLNILKNAEDALLENNIQNARIEVKTFCENDKKVLTIKDNAGGIPQEMMPNIFDPYFSTKLKKEGTGLGLYMSKTIIQDHCSGSFSVSNDLDGAVFRIEL